MTWDVDCAHILYFGRLITNVLITLVLNEISPLDTLIAKKSLQWNDDYPNAYFYFPDS